VKTPEKAPEKASAKEPEKASEKAPDAPKPEEKKKAAEALPEPPKDRKALEAAVKKYGVDAAIEALKKVKVVDLRSLAREFNGEFGIAGREIRNANKKVLIDEFKAFFSK
jgi:hypothetical protein